MKRFLLFYFTKLPKMLCNYCALRSETWMYQAACTVVTVGVFLIFLSYII